MSDGHRTSSIVRPRPTAPTANVTTVTASAATRRARAAHAAASNVDRDGTRFGDLTRPISTERQLVKGRGKRLLIAATASVLVAALLAAFFVLPVKSWFRQRDDIAERQRELTVLTAANAQLAADVTRLQTPDGIAEAARDEIGYVGNGEKRVTVTPAPGVSLTLPAGWPFDGVAQIIAVRGAGVTAPAVGAETVESPVPHSAFDPAPDPAADLPATPGAAQPDAG